MKVRYVFALAAASLVAGCAGEGSVSEAEYGAVRLDNQYVPACVVDGSMGRAAQDRGDCGASASRPSAKIAAATPALAQ